jgi:predicted CoA-binding protein
MAHSPLTRAVILSNMVEVDRVFWVQEGIIAPDALRELIGCAVLERYYADTPSGDADADAVRRAVAYATLLDLFDPVEDVRIVRGDGSTMTLFEYVQQAGKAVYLYLQNEGLVPDATAVAAARHRREVAGVRADLDRILAYPPARS